MKLHIVKCDFMGQVIKKAPQLGRFKGVLGLPEGGGALVNQVWTAID